MVGFTPTAMAFMVLPRQSTEITRCSYFLFPTMETKKGHQLSYRSHYPHDTVNCA